MKEMMIVERPGIPYRRAESGLMPELFIRLQDIGKRVEANISIGLEIEIPGAKHPSNFPVTAADINDAHHGVGGVIVKGDIVNQKRFTRAGCGATENVMVGRSFGKEIQGYQLSFTTGEDQVGVTTRAGEVSLDRQD